MPSPFPGMDPYLEGSAWQSFHGQYIAELARQLAPKIRPKYLALMGERELVSLGRSDEDDDDGKEDEGLVRGNLYPDVAVAEVAEATETPAAGGGTSVLAAPVHVRTLINDPPPDWVLEIRDAEQRRLVTLIELLSPSNKRGDDHAAYLAKRNHALRSPAHLVEIDLLHHGRRLPMRDPLPPAPYYVFVSRAGQRPVTGVWPIRLETRLPAVAVPLLRPDPDARLDLQDAFDQVYDTIGYDLVLKSRYADDPPVHLPDDELAWVRKRLAAAGRRAST